jgi:hypothetical protein
LKVVGKSFGAFSVPLHITSALVPAIIVFSPFAFFVSPNSIKFAIR